MTTEKNRIRARAVPAANSRETFAARNCVRNDSKPYGNTLTNLIAPLGLGWKTRARKKGAPMQDLIPRLKNRAQGRGISGLVVYKEER